MRKWLLCLLVVFILLAVYALALAAICRWTHTVVFATTPMMHPLHRDCFTMPGWRYVTLSNGARIVDTLLPFGTERGQPPPAPVVVLQLPGLWTHFSYQRATIDLLLQHRRHRPPRVLTLIYRTRLRCGLATRVDDAKLAWREYIVPRVLDQGGGRRPMVAAVVVVGYSYGAAVAAHWLARDVQAAQRLSMFMCLQPIAQIRSAFVDWPLVGMLPGLRALLKTRWWAWPDADFDIRPLLECIAARVVKLNVAVAYPAQRADPFIDDQAWDAWLEQHPKMQRIVLRNRAGASGFMAHVTCRMRDYEDWIPPLLSSASSASWQQQSWGMLSA